MRLHQIKRGDVHSCNNITNSCYFHQIIHNFTFTSSISKYKRHSFLHYVLLHHYVWYTSFITCVSLIHKSITAFQAHFVLHLSLSLINALFSPIITHPLLKHNLYHVHASTEYEHMNLWSTVLSHHMSNVESCYSYFKRSLNITLNAVMGETQNLIQY